MAITREMGTFFVLLLALSIHLGQCQLPQGQDPANTNAANNIFYLDKSSDCNGAIREIYDFDAVIRGNDLSSTRLGPNVCTIKLKSTSQFEGTVLEIEVISSKILDCGSRITIYDGELPLMSFDCGSNENPNRRRFFTTGDTATFVMTRQNVNNYQYDIEIRVRASRGSTVPGYENNFGRGYFFDKFPQNTIVALIGGFYAAVLVICIILIVVMARKHTSVNKDWEVRQLATIKSDEAFTNKRLVKNDTERSRPRYNSDNTFISEPDEDSDHFVEKVITSRVKTKTSRSKKPPAYEDAISEQASDLSSEEVTESSTSGSSIRKRPLSSDEERSDRSRSDQSRSSVTESETESEVSDSEDERSSRSRGARAKKPKRRPHKGRKRNVDEKDARPSRPPPLQPHQQVPYGAYPPGHLVPVMAHPPQFQPVHMMPAFQNYPEPRPAPPPGSNIQPTEPPVYSYLVQRGYTPLDLQSNAGSHHRQGTRQKDEHELRLDSGIEYMRR